MLSVSRKVRKVKHVITPCFTSTKAPWLATGANRLWHYRLLVRLNFELYLHCFIMCALAARNFPSQQAFITRQCNKQQSRGSDGAACRHSLAAPVIKPNRGKRQDTISAQTWKIKLCNESTDVICTPTTEEGWGADEER